jgi:hypothetical protein
MARLGVLCRDSGPERSARNGPVRGTATRWTSQWLDAPHWDGETDVLPVKMETS